MKAFVTGGTGLVGKPFVARLLAEGWEVALATRGVTVAGETPANLRVYRSELADAASLRPIIDREGKFDVVFHLGASLAYFGKRDELIRANVTATRNVLDLAMRTSARRFVYASSIEAVGTLSSREIPAGPDVRLRPVSTYGESKVLAEGLVRSIGKQHFPIAILRIGNVYAAYHHSFIIEFAQAILQRNRLLEYLPVYSHYHIQPAHNDDVTAGLLLAARSRTPETTATIAGRDVSVGEIFGRCAEVLGRRLPERKATTSDRIYLNARRRFFRARGGFDTITYIMAGSGRRVHRALSLDSAERDLGFRPTVALRDGIRESIEWHRRPGQMLHSAEDA